MVAAANASDELRFFVEPRDDEAKAVDASQLECLGVPNGVSRLVSAANDGGGLRLGRGLSADDEVRFEPIHFDRRGAVALSVPRGRRVHVNGLPAGRLHVLEVGDELQLDDRVLHLTEFLRPSVGSPPAELIGAKCPVCLVPVTADSNVLVHPGCGSPLHLDPETVPEEERLACALLGDCATCDQPVQLEAGYSYLPEL